MLKIKDNIELNELEKFGFKPITRQNGFIYQNLYEFRDGVGRSSISIYCELRIIEPSICFGETEKDLDVIFDLIQAGIVEKAVDNER